MSHVMEDMLASKIISIIRGVDSRHIVDAVKALQQGGVRFVEVTFNPADEAASRDTLRSIQLLKDQFGEVMHIGAGTVLTPKNVEDSAAAGAEFMISPDMNCQVIQRTKELGLVSMPGALTPTEVQTAWTAGADIVKIFPADCMGPAYFKALKAPLSHVRLAAVGGVSEKNIAAFLQAGADGFGIGGNLVNADRVNRRAWEEITAAARGFMTLVK